MLKFYVKRVNTPQKPILNFYAHDSEDTEPAYYWFPPVIVADLNTEMVYIKRDQHWIESIDKIIALWQFVKDEVEKVK